MISINYPEAKRCGGSPMIVTNQCPKCRFTLPLPAPFPPKNKRKIAVVKLSTNRSEKK